MPPAALRRLLFNPEEGLWDHPAAASSPRSYGDGVIRVGSGVIDHPRCLWFAAADNPNCPPDVLFALAGDPGMFDSPARVRYYTDEVCGMVAANPSCQPVLVAGLAGRVSHGIWNSLCERYPSQAADLIDRAARHPDHEMRQRAALHDRCPAEMLEQMASDPDWEVRCCVARNPSTPAASLQRLGADESPDVRMFVAANPCSAPTALETLAGDAELLVRRHVASNPACPRGVLERLLSDSDNSVRYAAELVAGLYWPGGATPGDQ